MRLKNKFLSFLVLFFLVFWFASAQGPAFRIRLFDTDYSNYLQLMWNEASAANYTLNFLVGGSDRSITLSGNPTMGDWFNQSVKTTAPVTFDKLTISTAEDIPAAFTSTDNSATITVSDDDTTAYMHASGGYASFGATSGALNSLNIIVAETTGYVGIGTANPPGHLSLSNMAINTTSTYYGILSTHTKSAGATDTNDDYYGIYSTNDFDQTGATIGEFKGIWQRTSLVDGTIGSGTEDMAGIHVIADLNAGTAGDDVYNQNENRPGSGKHNIR